jgi:hypothetical protein
MRPKFPLRQNHRSTHGRVPLEESHGAATSEFTTARPCISPFQQTEESGKLEWHNPYGSVMVMDAHTAQGPTGPNPREFVCVRF